MSVRSDVQIFGPYIRGPRIFFSGVPFSKKKDPRAGRGSYKPAPRGGENLLTTESTGVKQAVPYRHRTGREA